MHKDLLDASPLVKPEADESIDIGRDDASPVAIDKFPETPSSSRAASGSSCSQTSSSSGSGSGGDSDEDDDGDSASRSPKATNHLPIGAAGR
ncbi:hypothetical protein E2562_022231 [Oryza meyeriana var. granulata]|uniref:Uncharacterized protein n=1 Tax=Oryza meyeriana var. granulata TaxID=110450 RepID=A0A6G1ENU2_9ORYZ|nr:hypothetical protein E2562_022231 [Oryza meyeriana var. granulata]